MPTLTQLEYVLAVHKFKNFSRAAKVCHVSQPSLSIQIQKVESKLDIILFDRSKKPISTTSKGLEVIRQAQTILKEHRKFQNIHSDSGVLRGTFHLGVIPSLAPYVLPLFIESFAKDYPKVQFNIAEMKTQNIVAALHDESLDAGLLVTPLYDNKITEIILFYERFFVFASKKHELLKKKILSEKALKPHPVWILEEGHCFREQVIKVCSLNQKNKILANIEFESGSLETITHLVRRGRGYTLLPELATLSLQTSEKNQNLRAFRRPIPSRQVSLACNRNFSKQDILEKIEEKILKNLPSDIISQKKSNLEIIDI